MPAPLHSLMRSCPATCHEARRLVHDILALGDVPLSRYLTETPPAMWTWNEGCLQIHSISQAALAPTLSLKTSSLILSR